MNENRLRKLGQPVHVTLAVATCVLLTGAVGQSALAQPQPGGSFADAAFRRVWQRTDQPVAEGRVNRTWMWGPAAGKSLQEPFAEGPGGNHLVQYFDKARMEINDPSANPASPFFVTNGLLVVELVSGRIQTGVNRFESIGSSEQRVAGDAGSDAPSYLALRGVASVGLPGQDNRAPALTTNSTVPPVYMDRNGSVRALSEAPEASRAAAYVNETGHNIPGVFWDYINSLGPVYENGSYSNGPIMNWIAALGFPVTEPYWTSIRVGGKDRLVLFQAFQRRVLTYSPANPAGWKVEMGNVGAQYYAWRYEAPVVCQRVPVRGFGRVWVEHRSVQKGVGCPFTFAYGSPPALNETAVQSAFQPFEHGSMLWVNRTYGYGDPSSGLVYVFFDDGTFQQFNDTWREGQPVSASMTPPPGKYEPVRGFGKVWREGTGARVRERLGWAIAPEKGGAGAYQPFERGEMYWSGTVNKIWVLYGTLQGSPYPIPGAPQELPLRYETFNDTFAP